MKYILWNIKTASEFDFLIEIVSVFRQIYKIIIISVQKKKFKLNKSYQIFNLI